MDYKIKTTDHRSEMYFEGELKFGDHQIVDTLTTVLDDDKTNELVINLSLLNKLDSYGIGILLTANELANERGKTMAVRGATESITQIFEKFNLSEELTVLED